jgi:glyoxylase-like metal-dependent hydrolase (beta-lactamase superfamily II)
MGRHARWARRPEARLSETCRGNLESRRGRPYSVSQPARNRAGRHTSAIADLVRTLRLTDHLIGFYAGRVPGQRFAEEPNWVDDGALELGVCSYAVIAGDEALVYDTHISVPHAAAIRAELEHLGATRITVVLSHWHLDHIAGTEAFADCEIIANDLTASLLAEHRADIEGGRRAGPPPIAPLILPTTTFTGRSHLDVGGVGVDLVELDIHSRDATVLLVPGEGLLLAGDTLEDTVTYVSEPDGLERHVAELDRLRSLGFDRIYPNHGSVEMIQGGGYGEGLITATQEYIGGLLRHETDPRPDDADLRAFLVGPLAAGWVTYFEPYERVHASNLESVSNRKVEG